jgi:hypothetical protein
MIPSIDSYLYNEIESKMQIILSNRYIIEEILKEVQPSVSANFINAYTGTTSREIPIVYTMPQDKETQKGAIYIGLREGQESAPSIGFIEGTYDFKQGGLHKDPSYIYETPEQDRLYLEVGYPIGDLLNIENLILTESDSPEVEGNRIYFRHDGDLVGLGPFNVNYVETQGDEQGLNKGFTATEHYSVLAISNNMDTVRCLDLMIKSILILMRSNPEELNYLLLQSLKFGQVEEINVGTTSDGVPELLYGRETIVTYEVSYSLDAPLLKSFDEIKLNTRFSGGVKE